MNILFISQYFHPENFRGNDIAFDLAKKHKVHVICGVPNYPQGKFYEGYGLFHRNREVINGVNITRIPIIARGNNSIQLLLNYFSFMVNAWIYVLFHAINHKYDCVFVQQLSPVMMSMPGVLYKRLRNVPLYTWVLDLWPESLQAAGGINNKYILKFFSLFVKKEYKYSDKILVSSKSFIKSIEEYGDYNDKVVYFPQWAEDSISSTENKEPMIIPALPDGFKVMFAGNVGEAQDFTNIIKAAVLTSNHKDIKWIIVGDGRKFEWVKEQVIFNKLEDTVILLGRYPIETMNIFFKQADVMLVSLKNEPIFALTAPAKIQAYMSAKKAIVSMLEGEGANLIKEADCGYCVPAENAKELADLIIKLSHTDKSDIINKGNNGYVYYQNNFDKKICISKLNTIIECQ